jgi:hypothetical protein
MRLSDALEISGVSQVYSSQSVVYAGTHFLIKDDKSLWAWGDHSNGLVGDGTDVTRNEPVKILDNVLSIITYRGTAFSVRSDYSLWSWGAGVTGDGKAGRTEYAPVKIASDVKRVLISGGYNERANTILKTDNSIWTLDSSLTEMKDRNTFTKVLDNVQAWHSGGDGVVYLTTSGELRTRAYNNFAKASDRVIDANVLYYCESGGTGGDVMYIKTDGSLWGVGRNYAGSLGVGTAIPVETPAKILDNAVYATDRFALKSDGTLWSWTDQRTCLPKKIADNVAFLREQSGTRLAIFNDGSIKTTGQIDAWDMTVIEEGTYVKLPTRISGLSNVFSWSDNPAVAVELNGAKISFDQPPVIENGRTLVPIRAITEAMGAEVKWDESTQTATITLNEDTVTIAIGSDVIYKNGNAIKIDSPAKSLNGRTLVPLRAVAEAFGASVSWNADTQTASIERMDNKWTANLDKNASANYNEVPAVEFKGLGGKSYGNVSISEMYVENYTYEKLADGTLKAAFNIYNHTAKTGTVIVCNNSGVEVGRRIIASYTPDISSLQEWTNKGGELWSALWSSAMTGGFAYKANSNLTEITMENPLVVPAGGFIVITNDASNDGIIAALDAVDVVLQGIEIVGKLNPVNVSGSKEDILDDIAVGLFSKYKNVRKEAFPVAWDKLSQLILNAELKDITKEMASEVVSAASDIVDGLGVWSLVSNSAKSLGYSGAERIISTAGGPGGAILDGIFTFSAFSNLGATLHDLVKTTGTGYVVITNY